MALRIGAIALTALTLGLAQVPAKAQTVIEEPAITSNDARELAAEQGVDVIQSMRFNRTSGRWEIEGRDIDNREIDLEIDANTGAIMELERD